MMYTYAKIDQDTLTDLQSLEAEIGAPLVAMQPVAFDYTRLDRQKLARIRELEEKLGVVLLAVRQAG